MTAKPDLQQLRQLAEHLPGAGLCLTGREVLWLLDEIERLTKERERLLGRLPCSCPPDRCDGFVSYYEPEDPFCLFCGEQRASEPCPARVSGEEK